MDKKKINKYCPLLKRLLLSYLAVTLFFLLLSVLFNLRGVNLIKKRLFNKAEKNFNLAKKFAKVPNQMTFSLISTLKFNYQLSQTAEIACRTIRIGGQYFTTNFQLTDGKKERLLSGKKNDSEVAEFKQSVSNLSNSVGELSKTANESLIIKILVDEKKIYNLAEFVSDLSNAFSWLMTDSKRIIVLLQNSDEIRASGGFIGSYARIAINNGHFGFFDITDIYNPEGQFDGFIEPPPGVKEYLSNGKSWQVTDSNWHVDFPTAAQDIKNMMSLGGEEDLDLIVAVNLEFIEKIISDLGTINLSDGSGHLTSENFTEHARADRDFFIPGSTEKVDFLANAFSHISLSMQVTSAEQQNRLLKTVLEQINQKNILFYSSDRKIQQLFSKYYIDGSLSSKNYMQVDLEDDLHQHLDKVINKEGELLPLLYIIESNVGINKANRRVKRSVEIKQNDKRILIVINYINDNIAPSPIPNWNPELHGANHLSYINYQRIVASPLFDVKEVWQDGKLIKGVDQNVIQTKGGEEFNQTGFLITVPEQERSEVKIVFENTGSQNLDKLLIVKQPGLTDVRYLMKTLNSEVEFLLNHDIVVDMK